MRVEAARFAVKAGKVHLSCTARKRSAVSVWGQHEDIGPYPLVPFVPPAVDGKPTYVKPVMWQGTGKHDFHLVAQQDMIFIVMVEIDAPGPQHTVKVQHVKGIFGKAVYAVKRGIGDALRTSGSKYAHLFGPR